MYVYIYFFMLKHLTFKKILAIRKKRKELSDDAILIKGILAWGESYLLKCSYIDLNVPYIWRVVMGS